MKHKRQTLSKTDEEDNKDSLKGDDDSQPCSKFKIVAKSHFAIKAFDYHGYAVPCNKSCILSRFEYEEIMSGLRTTLGRHTRFNVELQGTQQ